MKTNRCGPINDVQKDVPLFVAGGDVKKNQLIGPLFFIAGSGFDRIAGVAQVDEIRPLDDASVFDIQTRYDSLCKHGTIVPRL